MAKLYIPGPCGDEVMEFDPKVVDKAAIDAKAMLDDLVNNHKMIVALKNPGDTNPTKLHQSEAKTVDLGKIDPEAELTVIPLRQGG